MVQFLDKYGYPVERIKGRPIINLIRLSLHTRRIKRGQWRPTPSKHDAAAQEKTP